eukprot:2383252-Prymnesium_polylepis.2
MAGLLSEHIEAKEECGAPAERRHCQSASAAICARCCSVVSQYNSELETSRETQTDTANGRPRVEAR